MSGIKRDFYDVCPACWSVRIKHRVFKTPRYKCEKCGSEFPNKKRISHNDRILFNEVMAITREKLEQRVKAMGTPYPEIDDIRVRKAVVMSVKELIPHA